MPDRPSRPGTLHVVATPLGHLDDLTLRAIRVLREVALVACEDTRRTANLLRAHGIATPTTSYFEHNERWIVEEIKSYFIQYKSLPTPTVFKYKVDELTKTFGDDKKAGVLKAGNVTQLRNIYQKITASDIQFVKDEFLTFCVNQSMKRAVLESADLVKAGEYGKIRTEVENALKAGMEKDLGHNYVNDVEQRLSEASRTCTKTNIPTLDELLDGGLGKGEFGFVIGPAGSGKIVDIG